VTRAEAGEEARGFSSQVVSVDYPRRGHAELIVDRREQHRRAIGAGVHGVELGHHALGEFEAELGYTGCSHRASRPACVESSCQRSFGHFRDSMALFFHPSRMIRVRGAGRWVQTLDRKRLGGM
jgi:hypothetical protein